MLYVNTYLPTIGGKELVVHQLAKSYQALGHKVRVVGPGCWRVHRKIKFPYPLHRWPKIPFLTKEITWLIQFFLAYILYKPDIVHAHSTYPNGYIAARLKQFLKFPLIITPHGEDINVIPEIEFGARLDPIIDNKIRKAIQASDYITAISNTVDKSILDAGGSSEKIVHIPNGVELKRFARPCRLNVYEYLDIASDSLLVITIGNYHERKGHEVLIEAIKVAIKKEPRIVLVIIGRTSEKLVNAVSNQGMSNNIKFTGSLKVPIYELDENNDIMAALLNKAIIYVSSSINEGAEGMSLALLEAMSANSCIIVTDISGNRDLIRNNENGIIVQPGSPKAISEAMIQILNDNNLQARLKEKGFETASQFDWHAIAKRYIELYKLIKV